MVKNQIHVLEEYAEEQYAFLWIAVPRRRRRLPNCGSPEPL